MEKVVDAFIVLFLFSHQKQEECVFMSVFPFLVNGSELLPYQVWK